MSKLPFHIALDHLPKIAGDDGVVLVGLALGRVESFARNIDAEASIKCGETILPMQPVAIEGAAHVEENRANHKPARNLRSALRCQNRRPINTKSIGTRIKTRKRSTRCSQINMPRAYNPVFDPRILDRK